MSIYKGNKLITGLPGTICTPDWDHSVIVSANTLYFDGYIVPSNGMIVGWFKFTNRIAVLDLQVNGITVARSSIINSTVNSEGNVQCPVNKGDELSLNVPEGIINVNDIVLNIRFVPYKA